MCVLRIPTPFRNKIRLPSVTFRTLPLVWTTTAARHRTSWPACSLEAVGVSAPIRPPNPASIYSLSNQNLKTPVRNVRESGRSRWCKRFHKLGGEHSSRRWRAFCCFRRAMFRLGLLLTSLLLCAFNAEALQLGDSREQIIAQYGPPPPAATFPRIMAWSRTAGTAGGWTSRSCRVQPNV